MDIKQRVMDDAPNSWLHKIAGIVPGFKGYMDRERRRDADKLLRTHLAKQFSAQRDRLNRVQQSLLRERNMGAIGEVDRLSGVLQRLIDRINTATYGYTGMFDPVKIEAEDLDQLYAFDMSLASGVDQVSSAVDALDSAKGEEASTAAERLSDLLDELNERLNQRGELLTSGTRLPSDQYQSLLDRLEPLPPMNASGDRGTSTGTGNIGSGSTSTGTGSPSMGTVTPGSSMGGGAPSGTSLGTGGSPGTGFAGTATAGEQARVSGSSDGGTPTLNLGTSGGSSSMDSGTNRERGTDDGTHIDTGMGTGLGTGTGASIGAGSLGTGSAMEPGISSLSEGNQSMSPMDRGTGMSGLQGGPLPIDDSAGSGVQSASSPAAAPGAPGHDIVDGMQLGRNMDQVADVDTDDTGTKRDA
jgi:hypothetical protein